MKAVVCSKYGSVDVLELKEVEKPTPGEGDILVKIRATTVSSGDVRVRRLDAPGLLKPLMRVVLGFRRPRRPILGTELSGEVETVGKHVTRYRKGDSIIAFSGMKFGAHAEYICLPEAGLVTMKPANASYEEAAAILFGGMSALHFLRKAKIKEGQKVLIYGASGAVGSSAVQLAKYYGAEVTGVCSTANVNLVKSLGAKSVIDYTKESLAGKGERYDIIFDAVGKISKSSCKPILAPKGRYVSVTQGYAKERIEDVDFLKELVEQGEISSVIDSIYTLEQLAEAHRHVENGHKVGNVVVRVSE
jgi:NADPH:quinone reductase-like Zn-dependent oxidoreductase